MIYTSYKDMADVIRRNIWKIPSDVGLIVGIPRSGMIPALMIAELLNIRCADIETFAHGGCTFACGGRGKLIRKDEVKKVLVLDDTVNEGTAMSRAKRKVEHMQGEYDILFGCVYAEGVDAKQHVDIYLHDIRRPKERIYVYEWNVLHHYPYIMNYCMMDIDGLICKEPPDERDTAAYEAYLPNAIPMVIPSGPVGALVTYRLEKYRDVTEDWLHRHGVQYSQLIMFPANTYYERQRTMSPGTFKAGIYANARWAELFIESDDITADWLNSKVHKPVFSYETGEFYNE